MNKVNLELEELIILYGLRFASWNLRSTDSQKRGDQVGIFLSYCGIMLHGIQEALRHKGCVVLVHWARHSCWRFEDIAPSVDLGIELPILLSKSSATFGAGFSTLVDNWRCFCVGVILSFWWLLHSVLKFLTKNIRR